MVALLGLVTNAYDDKKLPEMIITNLNALTHKYLKTIKTKKSMPIDINYKYFDNFSSLKNYITLYPQILRNLSFSK